MELKELMKKMHIPVLTKELITGLNIISGGYYLDTTLGRGGHSRLILQTAPDIKLTAIDRDEDAIKESSINLASYAQQINYWQGNFADYNPGSLLFDGIIADLGVSSAQLDVPERGFSFRHEAKLDMRMDQSQSLTAAKIINHWQEKPLADLFYQYGEERKSRRIARRIVEKRPFQTTTELAEAIAHTVPKKYRYGRIHPATRVFQALRIAVNQELQSLETFIARAPGWLKPQGKIGIISFHSLEDRIVKHNFRDSSQLQVLTKKPIIPQEQEIEENPRSRSAKLRFAQKNT